MNDLENQLRTMLRERAQDVTTLPPRITGLERPEGPSRPAHTRLWLVAAAVVAVLAVAGGAVLLGRSRTHQAPAGTTHAPAPTVSSPHHPTAPTTSAPAPSPHAARNVDLNWFGMAPLAGYTPFDRKSEPGVRSVYMHRSGDQGAPPGCNGCQIVPKSADVLVYARGRFHLGSGWTRTTVRGHAAWLGTTRWAEKYDVPSVAWEFRPGEWAVVQGLTAAANSTTQLRRIAGAVRPAQDIPIGLPFRLGYVPGLPITSIEDDRASGYAFAITLGAFGVTESNEVDITIWPTRTLVNYDTTGAIRRTIGGLPGYFSTDNGIAVAYHDGAVEIGTQGTPEGTLGRITDSLTWANGDGRAPLIPMESAIP